MGPQANISGSEEEIAWIEKLPEEVLEYIFKLVSPYGTFSACYRWKGSFFQSKSRKGLLEKSIWITYLIGAWDIYNCYEISLYLTKFSGYVADGV